MGTRSRDDFIWGANKQQIKGNKAQLGRRSRAGRREPHSKCIWKDAAAGSQLLGYSWPELMMMYEPCRTLLILTPPLESSVTLFSLGTAGKINARGEKVWPSSRAGEEILVS